VKEETIGKGKGGTTIAQMTLNITKMQMQLQETNKGNWTLKHLMEIKQTKRNPQNCTTRKSQTDSKKETTIMSEVDLILVRW